MDWTSGLDYWTDRFSFKMHGDAPDDNVTQSTRVPPWSVSMLGNTIFEASSLYC